MSLGVVAKVSKKRWRFSLVSSIWALCSWDVFRAAYSTSQWCFVVVVVSGHGAYLAGRIRVEDGKYGLVDSLASLSDIYTDFVLWWLLFVRLWSGIWSCLNLLQGVGVVGTDLCFPLYAGDACLSRWSCAQEHLQRWSGVISRRVFKGKRIWVHPRNIGSESKDDWKI